MADEKPGYKIHAQVKDSHELTHDFAKCTNGIALGSLGENSVGPAGDRAHLGGAPIGQTVEEGVVNENFEVHNYPWLYMIDGSIVPANPDVNPR